MTDSNVTRNSVFPMFVGCGRSGTTLFRNVFDSHPEVAITHEAHFVAPMAAKRDRYDGSGGFDSELFVHDLYNDSNFRRQGIDEVDLRAALDSADPRNFAEAVRVVFARFASAQGKRLYGDKTPGSVNHIELIGGIFPETKFVHIIRDGRAVALSYLERPEWGPKNMSQAAQHWKSRVKRGRKGGDAVGASRYREVRYEDMVDDPAAVTSEICDFLGLEYHPEMLSYHQKGESFISSTKDPEAFKNLVKPVTKGIRDWKEQIDADDMVLFESIAGDLLADLGYEVTATPEAQDKIHAAMSAVRWQGKRVQAYLARLVAPRRS